MNTFTQCQRRRMAANVAQALLPVHIFRALQESYFIVRRRITAKLRTGKNAGATCARATLILILCTVSFAFCNAAAAQVSQPSQATAAGATVTPGRAASDNPPANAPAPDTIGVIEGEALAVSGPMSV